MEKQKKWLILVLKWLMNSTIKELTYLSSVHSEIFVADLTMFSLTVALVVYLVTVDSAPYISKFLVVF